MKYLVILRNEKNTTNLAPTGNSMNRLVHKEEEVLPREGNKAEHNIILRKILLTVHFQIFSIPSSEMLFQVEVVQEVSPARRKKDRIMKPGWT